MTATLEPTTNAAATSGEPAWLTERRETARAIFGETRMPSRRDEHWRFTNLRGIDPDTIVEFAHDAVELTSGELPAGVVVAPLEQAVETHPDLVRTYLGTAVAPSTSVDDKFVSLNDAHWTNGVFVYVPRNVRVETPISAEILLTAADRSVNYRALIVLAEGAEATFVEDFRSADGVAGGFSNAVIELVAGKASTLHYVSIQDYAVDVAHFATHRVLAERDSVVEWATVGLGAGRGKQRMEARLVGPGSSVKLTGAYFLDGTQEIDYDTQQFHEAPNAFSDLAFKGVLTDRAHSVWRGMIDVSEGAQGTDSYQENRNLLLSKTAHADSIPGLKIEANEVRCTHGATISKVDPEQLFYLQARGLPKAEAVRQIVRGFYIPVLDRITVDPVRERVQDALWQRIR